MLLNYLKKYLNKDTSILRNCKRNLDLRKLEKNNYISLDDYLIKNIYKTEVSTIWFDEIPLDIIFQYDSLTKPLFVFFHGAVDQAKTVTPHFVGLSYRGVISANLLHIADSSLIYDEKIRAGWYLGCKTIPLQKVMLEVVSRLANYLETTKVIFFGSSGGGFPSLYLSQMISSSIAIVNSPATSILNHPHRSTRVSQYLKAAFGTMSSEDEEHVLKEQTKSDFHNGFDLNAGKVLYLLNINDKGNIQFHTSPFFKQFATEVCLSKKQIQHIGNIYLVTNDWGPGHRYPPARFLNGLFTKLTDKNADWSGDQIENILRELTSL